MDSNETMPMPDGADEIREDVPVEPVVAAEPEAVSTVEAVPVEAAAIAEPVVEVVPVVVEAAVV